MKFELTEIRDDAVIIHYLEADKLIVKNGCYQFQMNYNTNTREELKKEFGGNNVAIEDIMRPIYNTKIYYPISKYIVNRKDEN